MSHSLYVHSVATYWTPNGIDIKVTGGGAGRLSLAWVVLGLGLSWWEQQFPEDGCVEGAEDHSVEVDNSPEGRPQVGELGAHQPEGRGRLWTPFSWAALQRGLEEALHSFSYVWWREGWGGGGERRQLSASALIQI